MLFILKISVLVSLLLTTIFCFLIWPHRRILVSRLLMINMAFYSLWSCWVIITLLSNDFATKILFTKMRQVTTPFIVPIWFAIAMILFYRSSWEKYKKWFALILIIPCITSISTIFSLFNESELLFHNFKPTTLDMGLVAFSIGPLQRLQFIYASALIMILYGIYFHNFFSPLKHQRHYARLWFVGGFIPAFLELFVRYYYNNTVIIQFGPGYSFILCFTIYYGITRLEFLNIKSFAQHRILMLLPNPVITLTPRHELWDFNDAAKNLFQIGNSDLGKNIGEMSCFNFILERNEFHLVHNKTFQIFRHSIELKNSRQSMRVFVFNDVSTITELNQELAEINTTLKDVTSFNRKVQTVLSHDMTGVLGTIQTLAKTEQESPQMKKILRASESSVDLLKNILSWSYEVKQPDPVNLKNSLNAVLNQLSPLFMEKNLKAHMTEHEDEFLVNGSNYMIEAIFRNILTNAIKFAPEQTLIPIEFIRKEETIQIKISDSGKGIHFEDDAKKGYGIGLRFTGEFLKQLSGTYQITSTPDVGTTVIIEMPLA